MVPDPVNGFRLLWNPEEFFMTIFIFFFLVSVDYGSKFFDSFGALVDRKKFHAFISMISAKNYNIFKRRKKILNNFLFCRINEIFASTFLKKEFLDYKFGRLNRNIYKFDVWRIDIYTLDDNSMIHHRRSSWTLSWINFDEFLLTARNHTMY